MGRAREETEGQRGCRGRVGVTQAVPEGHLRALSLGSSALQCPVGGEGEP